jgi:TonB-linked SusC/RagA family outer membrane protein
MSEEEFIKKNFSFIDNLKIRGSYGQLGYDNVGNFQYLSTYNISSKYLINGVLENGIRIANLANPNITWEKMTTKNIGLDLLMWQNKFSFVFDYFYRLRSDVLGQRLISMPNVVGASLPSVNYAKYDNRGFEIEIGHRNKIGKINYNIGANLTWNRQKTILIDQPSFANEEERRRGEKNGKWTNRWWGYKYDGLFQSEEEIRDWADQDGKSNATILPGDIKLIDLNGDGVITVDDQTVIGRSTFPELMYGINLDFDYKGFYMNMLWQGAGEYDFNTLGANDIYFPFYAGSWIWKFWYDNAWTPENPWTKANPNGKFPRYRTDTNNRVHSNWKYLSDFWLVDGDYIRLKTLEIGYTLPKQTLNKYGIKNCRVFISGNNLLTFSKMKYIDPEIATTGTLGNYYPQTRVYNIGLTMNF